MTTTAPLDSDTDPATYLTLPVHADEGFPQSFLVALGAATYRVELYVDVAEDQLPGWPADPHTLIDLTGVAGKGPHGMLVGSVIRQGPDGDTVLLRRRLLPGIVYGLQTLRLYVEEARVALGNLNASGSFGSQLTIKVGPR